MPLRVLRVVNCAPATFQPAPAHPSRKPLPRVWPAAVAPFSPKVAIRLPDTPCSPPRPAGRKYSTALLTRSVGLAACDSGAVPKAWPSAREAVNERKPLALPMPSVANGSKPLHTRCVGTQSRPSRSSPHWREARLTVERRSQNGPLAPMAPVSASRLPSR